MHGISHTYTVYSILLTTTFFQRSLHATCHCITQMITQPINKTPDPFQKSLFSKNFPVGVYCILCSYIYELVHGCMRIFFSVLITV